MSIQDEPTPTHAPLSEEDRLARWRLALGPMSGELPEPSGPGAQQDRVLTALYESPKRGGLGPSSPNVARWMGDVREAFPSPVVQIMQRDALERLNLVQMLLQPETLETIEPDVHLVSTLLSLKHLMRDDVLAVARGVVDKLVQDILKRLRQPTLQAVRGALQRAARTRRPRWNQIHWDRTIRANLRNYRPEIQTVIPETLHGFASRSHALKHVMLAMDQSGSMAASVIYAGVYGSVLASIPSLKTTVVAFDTEIVDLSDHLDDPVSLLLGVRLGGGTDIGRALAYLEQKVTQPANTILVLVSDLFEGSDPGVMWRVIQRLLHAGVQMVALLALSDEGAPIFDEEVAEQLAKLGVPTFACTPDAFPDILAAAIQGLPVRPPSP